MANTKRGRSYQTFSGTYHTDLSFFRLEHISSLLIYIIFVSRGMEPPFLSLPVLLQYMHSTTTPLSLIIIIIKIDECGLYIFYVIRFTSFIHKTKYLYV